jgi:hypothetical protein
MPEISLGQSIIWLNTIVPKHFGDCKFDLEFALGDEDDWLLNLIIHGTFSVAEFRTRRHAICAEIRNAGHKNLYDIICIFQRHP